MSWLLFFTCSVPIFSNYCRKQGKWLLFKHFLLIKKTFLSSRWTLFPSSHFMKGQTYFLPSSIFCFPWAAILETWILLRSYSAHTSWDQGLSAQMCHTNLWGSSVSAREVRGWTAEDDMQEDRPDPSSGKHVTYLALSRLPFFLSDSQNSMGTVVSVSLQRNMYIHRDLFFLRTKKVSKHMKHTYLRKKTLLIR